MSATAKAFSRSAQAPDADTLAAGWDAPVPALAPRGQARVIHSWEAPREVWGEAEAQPAEHAARDQPTRPIGKRRFWLRFSA
jgi:hypothetical protein